MSVPGPPQIYRRPLATANQLEFWWRAPILGPGDLPIISYQLVGTSNNYSFQQEYGPTVYGTIVKNLVNNQPYTFILTASNLNGLGTPAQYITVQPGNKVSINSIINATMLTDSTAEVTWTFETRPNEADTIGFAVVAIPSTPTLSTIKYSTLPTQRQLIMDKFTNDMYNIKVFAVNDAGWQRLQTTNTITLNTNFFTNFPSAPTNVSVSGVSCSSFTISYKPGIYTSFVSHYLNNILTIPESISSNVAVIIGLTGSTNYSTVIRANNNIGSVSTIPIVVSTLIDPPTPITNLNVSGATISTFTVTWDGGRFGSTFWFNFDGSSTLKAPARYTSTSVSYDNLVAGTYHSIFINAINMSGSVVSPGANITTKAEAPTGVNISLPNERGFTVTWQPKTGAVYYKIRVTSRSGTPIIDNIYEPTSSPLTIEDLIRGRDYDVVVSSENASGSSPAPAVIGRTGPAPPTGLAISAVSLNSFTISWSIAEAATSYNIFKNGVYVANTANLNFEFTGLESGTTYTIMIQSRDDSGVTADSAPFSAVTYPAAPVFQLTTNVTQESFTVNWNTVTGATSYSVKVNALDYDIVTTTFYDAFNLTAGDTATVIVKSSLVQPSTSDILLSAPATISVLQKPATPIGLTSSNILSDRFTLSWTASNGNARYYIALNGNDANPTYSRDTTSTTFDISGVATGTSFPVVVKATNASGDALSAVFNVLTRPAAPTNLYPSNQTQTGLRVNWTSSFGATSYSVKVNAIDYALVPGGANAIYYDVTGLTAGTSNAIKVHATNASGSTETTTVSYYTIPHTPSTPEVASSTNTKITIRWSDDNNNPESGTIYLYYVNGTKVTPIDPTDTITNPRTATIGGLDPNTPYDITVVAVNPGGTSSSSTLLSGLRLWLDAIDPNNGLAPLANNASLTTWYDKSGYQNNTTTVTAGAQVTYGTNLINGYPAMVFTGVQRLTGAISIATQTMTIFAVAFMNSSAAAPYARLVSVGKEGQGTNSDVLSTSYATIMRNNGARGFLTVRNNVSTPANDPPAPDQAYLTEAWFDGTKMYATVQKGATTNIQENTSTGEFNIFNYSVGSSLDSALNYFTGYIAEVLIYDTALSPSDREKVEGYLSWKWGIQTNLPGPAPPEPGHPYAPPGATKGPIFGILAITNPAPPENVVITDPRPTGFNVNWTATDTATNYEITATDASGNVYYYPLVNDPPITASPYDDISNLAVGKVYNVVVIAVNDGRKTSSSPAIGRTGPEPAYNIQLVNPTTETFTITWEAGVGAVNFKISKDNGANFTAKLGNVRSHDFSLPTPGTLYPIVIKSLDNNDVETDSPVFNAYTLTVKPSPTSSNVTIDQYTVNWTDVSGAVSYSININSGGYILVDGGASAISYGPVTGLTAGSSHTASVRATNARGDSNDSASITIVTTPPAPPDFRMVSVFYNSINVAWDLAAGATLYYLSSDDGLSYPFSRSSTSFTYNVGITGGITYSLKVKAYNVTGGESVPSVLSVLTSPNPVTDLDASDITDTTCTVTFEIVPGATDYTIKIGGGSYQPVTESVPGDNTRRRFPVTGLSPGTTTIITVRSTNASGSTEATLSVLTAPAAPILDRSDITDNGFKVSWTDVTGASSYSYALTLNSVTVSATPSAQSNGASRSIIYSGLLGGTSYEVVVTAINGSGETPSQPITVLTKPIAVTGLGASDITDSDCNVNWNKVTGATSYSIKVGSGNFQLVTQGDVGTSYTYPVTGLSPGVTTIIKVMSSNNSGDSEATLPVLTAPAAPALTSSNINETGFKVSWTGATGATSYSYTLTDQSGTVQIAPTPEVTGFSGSVTWTGLTTSKTYGVVVTATNNTGSTPSSSLSVTTAPLILSSSNITTTTFTVNWTGTFGAATYTYRLNGNLATPDDEGVNGSQYYATFTGLLATFKYSVIVFVTNASGTGSSSPYLPQTANNILNLDAFDVNNAGTSTTFANNTLIATWSDKTISGGNGTGYAYNPSNSNCFYSVSANNGYPAIGLNTNSLDSYLNGDISITGNQITIFVVVNMSSSSEDYARVLSLFNSSYYDDFYFKTAMNLGRNVNTPQIGTTRDGTTTYPTGQTDYATYLHSCVADGATMTAQSFNGNSINVKSSADTNGNFAIIGYSLGSQMRYPANNHNAFFAGYICEVIIYNVALTQQQRYEVEGYLSWKWGLQEKLYNSHPYKNKGLQLTTLAPPAAPILSSSNVTYLGFTVTWTGALRASTYSYALTVPPGAAEGSYNTSVNGDGTSGTVTWTGLTESSQYSVIITAITGSYSTPSSSLSITTLAQPAPTAPSLTPSNVTAAGFTVNWTGATGALSYSYTLTAISEGPAALGSYQATVNGDRTSGSVTWIDLTPSKIYQVVITATNNTGPTPSDTLTISLPPANVAPTTPILSLSALTTNSFTISWTGGLYATSYTYKINGISADAELDAGISSKTATFSGSPNTPYTVEVVAVNNVGPTTSSILSVTIDFPILSTSDITNDGFTISWSSPTRATTYTYRLNGNLTTPSSFGDTGSQYYATFTGLLPSFKYSVIVFATNAFYTVSSSAYLPQTANNILNLDAFDVANAGTSTTFTNNTPIVTWNDKTNISGTAYAYYQSSTNCYYSPSDNNGYPAIFLNGGNYFNGGISITGNQMTFFTVVNLREASNENARILSFTNQSYSVDYNSPTAIGFGRNGYTPVIGAYRNNQGTYPQGQTDYATYLHSCVVDGTTIKTQSFNGNSNNPASSAHNNGNFDIPAYSLGSQFDGNAASHNSFFDGYICEIIIYNVALTQQQRYEVEGYLSWKWGLQGKLYNSHPYKNKGLQVTTINPPVAPIISTSNITYNGFTVTWTGATGASTYSYALTVPSGAAEGSYEPTVNSNGTSGSVTWTGLTASSEYSLVITSINSSGSAPSIALTVTTTPSPPIISSSSITSTGFTVNWTGTFGGATFTYRLNGNLITPSSSGVNGSDYYATFSGLLSSFKYSVIVFATNVSGTESSSPYLPQTANLFLNLDAFDVYNQSTSTTFANNTAITSWNDKSGKQGNSGSVSSANCYYTPSDSTNYPAIFLNNGHHIFGNIVISGNQVTIFAVANINSDAAEYTRIVSLSSNQSVDYNNNSSMFMGRLLSTARVGAYRNSVGTFPPDQTIYTTTLHECVNDGTTMTAQSFIGNSINSASSTNGSNFNVTEYAIGADRYGNFGYMFGYVHEVLVFNVALTQQQRYEVEGYLSWKWGLQGKLYDSHPYKNKGLQVTTLISVPAQVPIINVISIGSRTIDLTWGAVNADYYTVFNGISYATSNSNSITLSNLTPDYTYTISVIGTNAGGDGPPSAPVSVTTIGPPANLTANSITKTGFILNWSLSSWAINYYISINSTIFNIIAGGASASSYEVTNATPGQTYNIGIKSDPPYDETSSISFKTISEKVVGLEVSQIGYTSFYLTWTANSIAPDYYKVALSGVYYQAAYTNSALVSLGIAPNTSYTATVLASNNSSGDSEPSSSVTFTTLELLPPSNLAASQITYKGFRLTWTAATGATSYLISKNGGDSYPYSTVSSPVDITDVLGSTTYSVCVKSVLNIYSSSPTQIITVTTPVTPVPTAIINLVVSSLTHNSFNLSWGGAEDASSFIFSGGMQTYSTYLGVNSYSFTNLTPDTTYTFDITPINSGESGPIYTGVIVTTLTEPISRNMYAFDVASSASGQYLTTGTGNDGLPRCIYISSDYGSTWRKRVANAPYNIAYDWQGFACDSTGQYQVGASASGPATGLYYSTNYGNTWIRSLTSPSAGCIGIGMSSTGQYALSGEYGGLLFRSSNYGITWSQVTTSLGNNFYSRFVISSSGQYQATTDARYAGGLYTSNDYGSTWTPRLRTYPVRFIGLACNASGQKILVGDVEFGYIYISNDYGSNWAPFTSLGQGYWFNIACDSTGTYIVTTNSDPYQRYPMHRSTDGGNTWTRLPYFYGIYSYDMSSDGSKVFGGTLGAALYRSTDYGATYVTLDSPPILSSQTITYNGFTVVWTGALGATSYSYALTAPPGASEGSYVATENGTSGSVVWTGLTASSQYSVVITSINGSGPAPSNPLLVTTTSP